MGTSDKIIDSTIGKPSGKAVGNASGSGRIIGIDLGTTNSAMAVWDGEKPRLIPGAHGSRLTPSVVAFAGKSDVLVGDDARRQAVANPGRTIGSAKRFIGRLFDEVTEDREAVAYEIVAGKQGEALIAVGKKRWTPESISAHVLSELKKQAESFLGEKVVGAVIAVPAYFNDHQRTATREAGRLAGLDVRRIVNEPTAAALAYGLDKMHEQARTVAVYDFGGGTFDVSILSVGDDIVEVIATHGDTHLGGDDIDARITAWLREQMEAATGEPVDEDAADHERLREAAEAAKVELTTASATRIRLPGIDSSLHATLTLARFDEMISDLVDRTLASCAKALGDARKQPVEIDDVVLVGGSSRIPLVQKRVAEYFGKEPRRSVDPDAVVAFGAAVQAGILSGQVRGIVLVDVTSLSLGIEVHDGRSVVVIPRNTTLPAEASRIFTTTVDGQDSVQFHVVQGEAGRASQNDSLGRFTLAGLKDAAAGVPQIEVTFAIDINGVVEVRAADRGTGLSHKVTVTAATATASRHAPTAAASASSAPGASLVAGAGSGADAGEDDAAGTPSIAEVTLAEAEALLEEALDTMASADRASLTKKVVQLRALTTSDADAEQVERTRLTLRRLVTRVKRGLGRDVED